jgi:uncharacterized membrane protein YkoI
VKDSSSDVSPRESASSAIDNRRRQRRAQRSPNDQQYDNQAYAEDERPLPPPIERDDEEEQNVQNADRLVSHLAKEHRRTVNEVQQQNKKPKKKRTTTSDDIDHGQDDLHEQIREQQEIISKNVGNTDVTQVLPVEPLPSSIGTTPKKSLDQILEMAKRSRPGRTVDDG